VLLFEARWRLLTPFTVFERDPSVVPADSCANPASTTVIKCVLWGSPITAETAVNTGQWRNGFQVVIAGSNGMSPSIKYGLLASLLTVFRLCQRARGSC
jgi:hypothetical protein